jgi:multisubunit Na+/H+ antiporter MnhG subunit
MRPIALVILMATVGVLVLPAVLARMVGKGKAAIPGATDD